MSQFFGLLGQGFLIAAGIIIGMLAIFTKIVMRMQKVKYKASDLLPAFIEYLQKVHDEEWYEQRDEVLEIIKELTHDRVPDSIEHYRLKKDVLLHTESHGSGTTLRIEAKYAVIEKKPEEEQENKPE